MTSRPPPYEWLVIAFALAFPTLAAWLYLVHLSGPSAGANRLMQAAYAGCKVIQFALPLAYLLLADRAALRDLRLGPRGVGIGLGFGAAVGVGAFVLFEALLAAGLVPGLPGAVRSKVAQLGLLSPGGFVVLAAFLSLAHSGLEEYYWRGFVHARLRKALPFAAAAAVSSLAFMTDHVVILGAFLPGRFWAVVVPLSLCVAAGGAFWAWLYERSGSLAGPWLSHALIDVAAMTFGYRLLFG